MKQWQDSDYHRTLIEIQSFNLAHNCFWAIISGWDSSSLIPIFPPLLTYDLHKRIMAKIVVGEPAFLFAEVTLGAANEYELVIRNLEWVDEPSDSPLDHPPFF